MSARTAPASVAAMVESIVGCKWSVRLLGELAAGERRPSQLLRACEGLSAKVMNERLRKIQRFGLASRTVAGDKPPHEVRYALRRLGQRFVRMLDQVARLQRELDGGTLAEG